MYSRSPWCHIDLWPLLQITNSFRSFPVWEHQCCGHTDVFEKRKRKPDEFSQKNFWCVGQLWSRARVVGRDSCSVLTVNSRLCQRWVQFHSTQQNVFITQSRTRLPPPHFTPPYQAIHTHFFQAALSAGSHLSAFSVFALWQLDRVSITPS